jgi:cell division protein FtsI/penicillin-binding protein 2
MRAGQAVTAALAVGLGVALLGAATTGGLDARAAAAAAPPPAVLLRAVAPAPALLHAAAPLVPPDAPSSPLLDAPTVAPVLDLAAIVRAGDHYEAPLGATRARLTLVPRIQEKLRAVLERRPPPFAAAVVLDVATGRVLGFAGVSDEDPAAGALLPLQPFGPAASVFKLVTAAALLEADPAVADARTCFRGGLHRVDARDLVDDPRRDSRCVTLEDAVAHSLNVPIGKMALERLAPAALVHAAERFGFNRPLPFDVLAPASTARLPGSRLALARTAAGFEGVRLSALQGALLAATIASGGIVRRPGIADPFEPEELGRALGTGSAHALGRMMVGTTTEGTARREFAHDRALRDQGIAGKTGSLYDRERGLDFSWFVGFAPADAPRVAVAVFVANRALWHIRAPYVAREALAAALR